MVEHQIKTPVAFVIFNRPETTRRVFDAIRQARPPRLLVVADGPRPDRPGEADRCAAARAVVERVDWPCDVLTNYSETNLGCRRRVSSGLDWVFRTVEEAVVLEDDCLPHPTFFPYCQELLDRYRSDRRVATISGDNFQFGRKRTSYSYYFSLHPHIWGWATWRRVWQNYDVDLKIWPEIRDGGWLVDRFQDARMARYWTGILERTYAGRVDTWDHQLSLSIWVHSGLNILPNVNLVSNIGFGNVSTHTRRLNTFADVPAEPMEFPLRHPPFLLQDLQADRYEFATHFRPGYLHTARNVIRRRAR